MKDGFRRLLHKRGVGGIKNSQKMKFAFFERGVGGIKNSQKMKFAFFDCFYVMLPLKKGVHYRTLMTFCSKCHMNDHGNHLVSRVIP